MRKTAPLMALLAGELILVSVVLLWSPEAHAQPVDATIPGCEKLRPATDGSKPAQAAMDEARERYERGRQLYSDGAFEQALLEFERAYELAPAYRILYNVAQVAMILNDYPKAICAFEGYLAEGKVDEERRKQVQAELDKLRGRVAYLDIKTDIEGAEIQLDDVKVGETPLAKPILVNAGRHRVVAKYPGRLPAEDFVTLAGQDNREITLDLKELPKEGIKVVTPVPVPGQPPPQPPPPPAEPSYVWVGWVVTGTLAAGAVATGIGTLAAANKLGDLRETSGVTAAELDDQQSTARTLGIVTDVLAASAIVAGGVTLYFQLTEGGDEGDVLEAGVSPTGLTLRGSF